jgi:hypothetical protein
MSDEQFCEPCMGMGVSPVHANDCDNDLCSFGVGEVDCHWSMVDCEACDGTGIPRESGPHYREANQAKRRAEEALQQVPF